jgi:hypothetical protein
MTQTHPVVVSQSVAQQSPSTGSSSVTFLADDPAREVGAPAWPESAERLLVVVSEVGPTERLDASQGEQAVQQWREA